MLVCLGNEGTSDAAEGSPNGLGVRTVKNMFRALGKLQAAKYMGIRNRRA